MALQIQNTQTDEAALFALYKKTKDKKVRDKIVENYIYIAEILSRRFINRGIDYDDIYQVACMGILLAVERFDPDRGLKFASYATPTVYGEIQKFFRDKGNFIKIPRKLYQIFYRAEKIKRAQANLPQSEVARILNLPEEMVREAYKARESAFISSLEEEAFSDGEMTLSNVFGKEDNNLLMLEDKDFIRCCMRELSDREREFVILRYYNEKTQSVIASYFGVSQMQVSRIEKQVLKKLRDMYFKNQ